MSQGTQIVQMERPGQQLRAIAAGEEIVKWIRKMQTKPDGAC
jgi:hypothetical protein